MEHEDNPLELGAPYLQTNLGQVLGQWGAAKLLRQKKGKNGERLDIVLIFRVGHLKKHAMFRLVGKNSPFVSVWEHKKYLGGFHRYKQPKPHGFLEKNRIPCVIVRLRKFTDSQTADMAPSPPGCHSSSAWTVATPGASVQFKNSLNRSPAKSENEALFIK
jgi:hypothetical protein